MSNEQLERYHRRLEAAVFITRGVRDSGRPGLPRMAAGQTGDAQAPHWRGRSPNASG